MIAHVSRMSIICLSAYDGEQTWRYLVSLLIYDTGQIDRADSDTVGYTALLALGLSSDGVVSL